MIAGRCSGFSTAKETSPPTRSAMERCGLVAVIELLFSCSILFRSSAHRLTAQTANGSVLTQYEPQ